MDWPTWIDGTRYVLAVLCVISIPPALGYWFVVHPFVGFWRRVGPARAYVVLTVFYLGSAAGLFLVRDALVGRDFGTSLALALCGLPLIVVGMAVAAARGRQLTLKILVGLPEVSPDRHGTELLHEGIYGRVRHPRYLEFMVAGPGWALVINYLGVYVVMALTVVLLHVIARLEERELRERFGEAYVDYCARVPRFVPRWR